MSSYEKKRFSCISPVIAAVLWLSTNQDIQHKELYETDIKSIARAMIFRKYSKKQQDIAI